MRKYKAYKTTKYDWLGEIPSHWSVRKTRFIFEELNDKSETGLEELLSVSQYTGIRPKRESVDEEKDNLTNASSLEGYKIVREGNLVMNIMLAWNGSLGISKFNGIVSPAYCVFKLNNSIEFNPKYYHYLYKTEKYKAEFKRTSTGIIDSRLRLYPDKFYCIPSIVPPKEEQDAIVNFIDNKLKQLNLLMKRYEMLFGKIDRKRGLIKEYKDSLIETCVLGQIEIINKDLNDDLKETEELVIEGNSQFDKHEID
ncbi:hypothetical protein ABI125_10670 [Tamlana crocina]